MASRLGPSSSLLFPVTPLFPKADYPTHVDDVHS